MNNSTTAMLRGSRPYYVVFILIAVVCMLVYLVHNERITKKQLIERKDILNARLNEIQKAANAVKEEEVSTKTQLATAKTELEKAHKQVEEKEKAFNDLRAKSVSMNKDSRSGIIQLTEPQSLLLITPRSMLPIC